ncbi:M20 family metallopeptidase [Roseovarius sp. 2305UL8-3]|uniref:M20 family metallopeptidase n=1 Tax=Roseovarius conchicola TaxID=3121636 RepID=UPI0035293B05
MTDPEITETELIKLTSDLVRIQSHSGDEHDVQTFILDWFSSHGITCEREPAKDGLFNVVTKIEGQPGGPTLWIGGHSDTVSTGSGWSHDPYDAIARDRCLYGRGTMDMKGGLACTMLVARNLHAARSEWHGRVIFASLADEEAFSRGAEAHVFGLEQIDAALMCEPHFDDVTIGAMGKVNIDVEVTGRAGHASRPWQGVNAICEAGRLLALLADFERPASGAFRPSHCVFGISAGNGSYTISIPDQCSFRINWHFGPDETVDDGIAQIEGLAQSLNSPATFTVSARSPQYDGYLLAGDHPLVTTFTESAKTVLGSAPRPEIGKGVSDANILCGRAGIPTLLFGPRGGNMHSDDEYVELDSLIQVPPVLMHFARSTLVPQSPLKEIPR